MSDLVHGISLQIRHGAECLLNGQWGLIEILATDEDILSGENWVRFLDFYKSVLILGREGVFYRDK